MKQVRKNTILRMIGLGALLMLVLLMPGFARRTNAVDNPNMANLVVMVRFSDDTSDVFNAGTNWTRIKNMYDASAATDSLSAYLLAISDGNLRLSNCFPQMSSDGTTVNVLTLSRTLLESNDASIIGEVISAINNGTITVPSGQTLDYRSSGVLDNLTVLLQGETTGATDELIYPHKGNYGGSETFNGLLVRTYNFIDSGSLVPSDGVDPYFYGNKQGVIAHEFLHSIGLPDLYRYSGGGDPVGRWDIMASVSPFLTYPLIYSRASLGWASLTTITTSGTYTLDLATLSSGTRGYKITTPLSSSEFFVLEYRVKPDQSDFTKLDHTVPSSGLLIYRVNPNVSGQTNAGGSNYIYIFRPDVTDKNLVSTDPSADTAAIDVSAGETSYGSVTLDAAFTDNTIYYADGSNSGIALSDLSVSGTQLTFTITFADYSTLDLWDAVGSAMNSDSNGRPLAVARSATDSKIYAAYTKDTSSGGEELIVQTYADSAWSQTGSAISDASSPSITTYGGNVYLLCEESGRAACYRLDSGSWTRLWRDTRDYPQALRFVSATDGLYVSFAYSTDNTSANCLVILDATTGSLINNSLVTSQILTNPSVCKIGSVYYAAYTNFSLTQGVAGFSGVAKLDTTSGNTQWTTDFYTLSSSQYNTHSMCTDGTKLYLYSTGNSITPSYAVYADGSWTQESVTSLSGATDVQLLVVSGVPHISGRTSDGKAKVYYKGTSGWTQLGENAQADVAEIAAAAGGGKIYVVGAQETTGSVTVRSRNAGTVTPGPDPQTSYTVSVVPPSGYTDTKLWIDGVAYTATIASGTASATLSSSSAKTVTMYKYNSNNVPIGMYVWTLEFANGAYTATALPDLADLLSYHGFSIRVEGNAGLRFKTGISTTLRAALLSNGVDGYRLVEYGTLFTGYANLATRPFIKGGEGVASGRAYWTENGQVTDLIFETVQGRYRFTSVITGVPSRLYRTTFAFRGYIILEKDGTNVLFYGPVVGRSIYTVAEQVLAAGEFPIGSRGDLYVRNLIDSAGPAE